MAEPTNDTTLPFWVVYASPKAKPTDPPKFYSGAATRAEAEALAAARNEGGTRPVHTVVERGQ